MHVDIEGSAERVSSTELQRAAQFFADQLMGTKLSAFCSASIQFVKGMKYYDNKSGSILVLDPESKKPRDFLIRLEPKMGRRGVIRALAHEMVHAKQYATGEYVELEPARAALWLGEKVNPTETDYWERPWEIEAMGREEGLLLKWLWKEKNQ